MKLFSKKTETDNLHTLNEKEIQKRLYGKYHREGNSNPGIGRSGSGAMPPQLEIPEVSRPFSFSNQLKNSLAQTRNFLFVFVKKIRWKFLATVTAALIVAVILFQVFSFLFTKIKTLPKPFHFSSKVSHLNKRAAAHKVTPRSAEPKKEAAAVKAIAAEMPQKAMPVPSVIVPSSPLSLPKPPEALKKRYYSVQICTYQREQDAKQLVEELKNADLPAFHLRILSSQQPFPHYVVFLGKEKTYADANVLLREFRKTQHFQKFPDSFVRSI